MLERDASLWPRPRAQGTLPQGITIFKGLPMAALPLFKICCMASVAEAQQAHAAGAAALGLISVMCSGPRVISDALVAQTATGP